MRRLNVLIPEETHRKLKVRAGQNGKTMKAQLVDIINEATKDIKIKTTSLKNEKG